MATQSKVDGTWKKIIAKACMDEGFKEKLLTDPVGVFKAEGVEVPPGKKIRIIEAGKDEAVFILPPAPEGGQVEADDERLAAVVW